MVNLASKLVRTLAKKNSSLAVAESCTGGRLASAITSVPGSSKIFPGGVVTYSEKMKRELLKVSAKLIANKGVYDTDVAVQMARGTRELFHSDWGLAVTGVAGPQGGTRQAPVGTVFFGLVGPSLEKTARVRFTGSRQAIQTKAVKFALSFIIEELASTKG